MIGRGWKWTWAGRGANRLFGVLVGMWERHAALLPSGIVRLWILAAPLAVFAGDVPVAGCAKHREGVARLLGTSGIFARGGEIAKASGFGCSDRLAVFADGAELSLGDARMYWTGPAVIGFGAAEAIVAGDSIAVRSSGAEWKPAGTAWRKPIAVALTPMGDPLAIEHRGDQAWLVTPQEQVSLGKGVRAAMLWPDRAALLLRNGALVFRSRAGDEVAVGVVAGDHTPLAWISTQRVQIGTRCFERRGDTFEIFVLPVDAEDGP